VKRLAFLNRLYPTQDNIRVNRKVREKLSLRNSIDEAIQEDCKSAGFRVSIVSDSSEDPADRIKKDREAFIKAHGHSKRLKLLPAGVQ
jgi:hypothetical protein